MNTRLTKRVVLLRTGETLQQSVSATSRQSHNCCRVGVSSMSSPAASTAAARRIFRRFRRNRRGSAAVEFALVAPVFFALLFAIIETGIMFFANQVLESITQNAARQVLTGQAQANNYPDGPTFTSNVVCPPPPAPPLVLFNCSNLFVDVKSYSSFSSVVINSQIVNGSFDPSTLTYSPGGPGDIVVVRFFYKWPLFVTGLGYNIANLSSGNQRLLVATAAFQNEPY
jgi:Flp pilus assembly protein TadG